MKRAFAAFLLGLFAFAVGGAVVYTLLKSAPPQRPDAAALVTQMREVARLETLDVTLYKKVSFAPEPAPADTVWGELANWARFTLRSPRGKAIVFAQAHIGLDLSKLDASRLQVEGDRVEVALPPLRTQVELEPGETEVIGSNLDSAETAQLFDLAKSAFQREVDADGELRGKARASAERALRGLFTQAGFREVRFVDQLTPHGAG